MPLDVEILSHTTHEPKTETLKNKKKIFIFFFDRNFCTVKRLSIPCIFGVFAIF